MRELISVMKTKFAKFMLGATVAANTMILSVTTALAEDETAAIQAQDLKSVYQPIIDLINAAIVPALLIVGALGTLYCILLGVKFAKAEEPQDREKAKTHLKNAIIGFVLIFVLMAALAAAMPILAQYAGISLK